MDTKSKNFKYSLGAKLIAMTLVWLSFLGAAGSSLFMLYYESRVRENSYFETYEFANRFTELVWDAVQININLKNDPNVKDFLSGKDVKSDSIEVYQSMTANLSSSVNFSYYIKNTKTGNFITNMKAVDPKSIIEKQPAYVSANQWKMSSLYSNYMGEIQRTLSSAPYEVSAAVIEPLKPGDAFYNEYTEFNKVKAAMSTVQIVFLISIFILVLCSVYLAYAAGRKEDDGKIHLAYVDKIYFDIHTLLVGLAALASLFVAVQGFSSNSMGSWFLLGIILSLDSFIGISYAMSVARQIKAGILLENTLAAAIIRSIAAIGRACFDGKLFKASAILLFLGYGFMNGILFLIMDHLHGLPYLFFGVLILALNIAAAYLFAKSLWSLTQIMEAVKETSKGNINYSLNARNMSMAFSGFAQNIMSMQSGLKKAVEEAIKGERMKTELITNVSHDLKTPLTSIINYVDLLEKEKLDNENAVQYVAVLSEKSARLKQLVEDLIEASKASSGNLTVSKEKIDFHELVLQACGEYEEKLNHANLDVRVNADPEKLYVLADGKYMWRIMENLLTNVVKYAMANTRVYVNLATNSDSALLTVKNISAFPLDIPADQLTERFIRGDLSRSTEGSGLGLSIAKSLASLQGGKLDVSIDGDLFKVVVEMPLWNE